MNAHIVDLDKEHHHGGVDIDVAIHGPSRPDGSIPLRGSEVRRVNNMYQLSQMRRCVMAAEGSSVGRVREGRGDHGEMMVVSTRRNPTAQDGE